jgi:RNA polymerase sigma factor (sigma-70 family)
MTAVHLHSVLHHLHALTVNGQAQLSDGQLLERFAADRDAAAFEALLRRHGPLVLSVGRRVLGAGPDLEDVFQATFLVLARKAGSIRKHGAVASWLYGVAWRLAQHQKAQRAHQDQQIAALKRHLAQTRAMPLDPTTRASWQELGTILDEELQRLPVKYREALVLCHLEGLGVAAAAAQLGWSPGTLKSRLLRGRELLRRQLTRRGVSLSVTGLAVVLAEQAAGAALPARLLRAAVQGGIAYAARPLPCAVVSVQAAALAEGVTGSLTVAKLPLALVVLLLGGLLCVAVSLLPGRAPGAATKHQTPPAPLAEVAQPPAPSGDVHGDPLPPGAVARLGTLRWRHGGAVDFIAMSADGKTVVSASADRVVHVWDFATGKELYRFAAGARLPLLPEGTTGTISKRPLFAAVALSQDGKVLAVGSADPAVQLWDLSNGQKRATIPLEAKTDVGALAFAPDGKHLALADARGLVRLWDLQAGKFVRTFEQADRRSLFVVRAKYGLLLFAPDGKTLVCAVTEAAKPAHLTQFQFWDAHTGKALYAIKVPARFGPTAAVFSRDGTLFAFGTTEGEVCVHQASGGKLLQQWQVSKQPGLLVAFGADNGRLYTKAAGERAIQEWEVASAKPLRRLVDADLEQLSGGRITALSGCLTLAADGKALAVGGDGNILHFIDLNTGKKLALPGGHIAGLLTVAYTPDGKWLLTRSGDRTLRKWDAATGKQFQQLSVPAGASQHAVTPDGRILAVLDDKFVLRLIDADNGKELSKVGALLKVGPPMFFFAPDGKTLVVRWPEQTGITLYNVPSGQERCRVAGGLVGAFAANGAGGPETATTFFFSPDSRRLAVFAAPRTAAIYDTASGQLIQQFLLPDKTLVRSGAFSPDGRLLAIEHGSNLVSLVELATSKERLSLGKPPAKAPPGVGLGGGGGSVAGPIFGPAGITTLAFSPDGRVLTHSGRELALTVWDVATGTALARFDGHQGPITTVAFAPDGRSVATGSIDCTALVWDVRGLGAKAGPAPGVLDAAGVQARWEALAAEEAAAAHDAINALVAAPKQSVPWLKSQLKPDVAVAAAEILKWIEQLDSAEFQVRAHAKTELLRAGDQVLPYAAKELARKITLEVRQSLLAVEAKLAPGGMTGERLRMVRAIEVLERIGNADARQVLQMLAAGAPGGLATTHAQAALRRLQGSGI